MALLGMERDRVVQEATARMHALEADNMETKQRLAQVHAEFNAINGGQAKEQYIEMESKLRSTEEKLNAKDEQMKTYIAKYEAMLGTEQEKIKEYVSKLSESGRTIENMEKNLREARAKQTEKERAVDKLKEELKKVENENKFLKPELDKEGAVRQRANERSRELYEAKKQLEEKLATANKEFEELKAESDAKNEELKKIGAMEQGMRAHEYEIARLQGLRKQDTEHYEKKIAALKKQMEGKSKKGIGKYEAGNNEENRRQDNPTERIYKCNRSKIPKERNDKGNCRETTFTKKGTSK